MKSDGLHDDKPLPERLRERAAEADQMAANLNNGVRKWRMCVPVQHDDTDMIVARLITSAREAADELERLTARSESGLSDFPAFDCHYDGDINRCAKDCKQLGECKRRTTGVQSATLASDQGTEKLLRDLLDRIYKMNLMAIPSLRVGEVDSDSNDPLVAWMSDARKMLYGSTKPRPENDPIIASVGPSTTKEKP